MTVSFLTGDCRQILKAQESNSIHCCVTSPPYLGLRNYDVEGQIGLETSPDAYVSELIDVFREVRRVLRKDGTLWLILGDSYCNTDKWGGGGNLGKNTVAQDGSVPSWAVRAKKPKFEGIKPKDLMGMPWRVAFALRDDGWYLRQDIIWHKPNPMPESVTDRCTKAHEYIFLLSKSPRYYFDCNAIKETAVGPPGGNLKPNRSFEHDPIKHRTKAGLAAGHAKARAEGGYKTRQKRSVWRVTTKPFKAAHFATFPPDLIEPCILAGCPVGGTVIDPFGGAGTTAVVAAKHNRNSILIELNPDYVSMAKSRVAASEAR